MHWDDLQDLWYLMGRFCSSSSEKKVFRGLAIFLKSGAFTRDEYLSDKYGIGGYKIMFFIMRSSFSFEFHINVCIKNKVFGEKF